MDFNVGFNRPEISKDSEWFMFYNMAPYLPPRGCEPHIGPGQMNSILEARMPQPVRGIGSERRFRRLHQLATMIQGGAAQRLRCLPGWPPQAGRNDPTDQAQPPGAMYV